MSARLDAVVIAALEAIMDAPACPQNFSAKQLARVALHQEARITKAGNGKFLKHAQPLEGRIDLVADNECLKFRLKFLAITPKLYLKLHKEARAAFDTVYRIAHGDGAVNERRLIEQKLKVVL